MANVRTNKLNNEKYRGKFFDGFNRIERMIGLCCIYQSNRSSVLNAIKNLPSAKTIMKRRLFPKKKQRMIQHFKVKYFKLSQ